MIVAFWHLDSNLAKIIRSEIGSHSFRLFPASFDRINATPFSCCNKIWRCVSVQHALQYFDLRPFWLWQNLLYRIITLGSLGRIVCKPSSHDSLLLWSTASWIPRHERRWCAISRRDSWVRPSQIVVPKGGLLVLDDLMAEEGEDKELLDLFTKHYHHQTITVSESYPSVF